MEDNDQYDFAYTFFHNYLTELYGEPRFTYTDKNVTQTTLIDQYAERFKCPLDTSFYPVEIWSAPSSHICLLRANKKQDWLIGLILHVW